jgi:hypothetical protein
MIRKAKYNIFIFVTKSYLRLIIFDHIIQMNTLSEITVSTFNTTIILFPSTCEEVFLYCIRFKYSSKDFFVLKQAIMFPAFKVKWFFFLITTFKNFKPYLSVTIHIANFLTFGLMYQKKALSTVKGL